MLQLTRILSSSSSASASSSLTLTFEDRRRSRLLVRLDDGREGALRLPRGTVLRDGDLLGGDADQPPVLVRAAAEELSVVRTADPLLLSRGAYHLGNRHVPLQIGPGWLAYQHDHVLDDLARALGLSVTLESGPFEPEGGGYPHKGSAHGKHEHPHAHPHDDHHHGESANADDLPR